MGKIGDKIRGDLADLVIVGFDTDDPTIETEITWVYPEGEALVRHCPDSNGNRVKTLQVGGILSFYPHPDISEHVWLADDIEILDYALARAGGEVRFIKI